MMTKYQKADLLRKKYVAAFEEATYLMAEYEENSESKLYKMLADTAQKEEDEAFKCYSSYIHCAFHQNDIKKAMLKTKRFATKEFLIYLTLLDQRRIKKGSHSYV